jgi:menaquinone-specific isochorismate synthase
MRERQPGGTVRGGIVRFDVAAVEIPAVDLLGWLSLQEGRPRFFWRDRDSDETWAAAGRTVEFTAEGSSGLRDAVEAASAALRDAGGCAGEGARARFFGGAAFDGAVPGLPFWRGFGAGRLVLPEIALRRRGGRTSAFATRAMPPGGGDEGRESWTGDVIRRATAASASSRGARTGRPGADPEAGRAWAASVREALSAIRSGGIRKVVLARTVRVCGTEDFDPMAVLSSLVGRADRSFVYMVDPGDGAALVGATPERLVKVEGDRIESEGLAGTCPRGDDDAADAAALLSSEKDLREHAHVVSGVSGALAPLCEELEAGDGPEVVTLANAHHLRTAVRGVRRRGVGVGDLLTALHPTPAVAGEPRDAAMALIRSLEPAPRGWYAGPVGWVGGERAEFAVALRCALLQGADAWVYAGAGIVEGSDPALEWAETEIKARTMLDVLTGQN